MFKDTDRELARLEAALLEAEEEEILEEDPEEEYEEDYEEEYEEELYDDYEEDEDVPAEYFYTDTRPAHDPVAYQNYSNDYGRDQHVGATGYRAYNSDDCDEDLDAFSEEVYEARDEGSNTGLLITACVLAAIFGGTVLFIVLKYIGVL
jgi:hypothetical protein